MRYRSPAEPYCPSPGRELVRELSIKPDPERFSAVISTNGEHSADRDAAEGPQVGALRRRAARVLGRLAALAHLVPEWIGDALPRQRLAKPRRSGYQVPHLRLGSGSDGGLPKAGSLVKSSASNGVLAAASRAVSAGRFQFSSSSLSTEVWCSFWRDILIVVPVFLAYLAITAFASGTLRLMG
jgi:hypothetical protein